MTIAASDDVVGRRRFLVAAAMAAPAATASCKEPSVPPTMTNGRLINVLDFGATGRTGQDDWDAINRAIAECRRSGQSSLWLPANGYEVSRPLNVSGVSIVGAGAYASTIRPHGPFASDAIFVLDGRTVGGAAHQTYESFGIAGSRGQVRRPVRALQLIGDVLHNRFSTIRITEMSGDAITLGPGGGARPTGNKFNMIRTTDTNGNGLRITAGKYNTFDLCDWEQIGGRAVDADNALETPSGFIFDNCYAEKLGSGADGVRWKGCYGFEWRRGNIQEYGDDRGASGHGFAVIDSYFCSIDGAEVSGRRGSTPTSKKYFFRGGARNVVRGARTNVLPTDLDAGGTDLVVTGAYKADLSSLTQIPVSHISRISAGTTAYLQPGTGLVSSSEGEVSIPAVGRFTAAGLVAKLGLTSLPSRAIIVTLMKNGAPTGLSGGLSAQNRGAFSSFDADASFTTGDTYSIRIQSFAGAPELLAGAVRATIGVLR